MVKVPKANLVQEAAVSSTVVGDCLEIVVGRHFVDSYYALLINPDSHRDFYDDWITDIQAFMTESQGLRYSVLANAASNLYLSGEPGQMQELALSYYSRSLRGVTQAVSAAKGGLDGEHNAILISVMLLYLHGCMGHGTYADIPLHVDAAIRMITWRWLDRDPPAKITRPFDRLAVESVVYQVFLLKMGLWSERFGDGLHFNFNPLFWLKCEALLSRSVIFPELSNSTNSPVLGLPFTLFKIMLMIRTLWEEDRSTSSFRKSLAELKEELQPWETWLGVVDELDDISIEHPQEYRLASPLEGMTKDATTLMILAASLLVMQLGVSNGSSTPGVPRLDSWQVPRAVQILSERKDDPRWETCCLANYPIYVVGHFMRTKDEIALIRNEMLQRSSKMAWSQVHRFWDDLEARWALNKLDLSM